MSEKVQVEIKVPLIPIKWQSMVCMLGMYFFGRATSDLGNEPWWTGLILGGVAGFGVTPLARYIAIQYIHELAKQGKFVSIMKLKT